MSDIMYPVSFGNLMNHIMTEYKMYNRIYNVNKIHRTNHDQRLSIFGKSIENPVGPAAGPNTQLAQKYCGILCSWCSLHRIKNCTNYVR